MPLSRIRKNILLKISLSSLFAFAAFFSSAHQQDENLTSSARYLANEGVVISHNKSKVVFDPFFHNNFNTYQLVPEEIRQKLFQGQAPYDNIKAVFISHAHEDHFSAKDMLQYLKRHPEVHLFAPQQAIAMLEEITDIGALAGQVTAISQEYGEQAKRVEYENIRVEVVRIPHAGWPRRARVENLVFRVSIDDQLTVMHMGDADPDDAHYIPYKSHWQSRITDTAFPPYWFFYSAEGRDILHQHINARHHIGVHVPMKVPARLKASKMDFFSVPGETRSLTTSSESR